VGERKLSPKRIIWEPFWGARVNRKAAAVVAGRSEPSERSADDPKTHGVVLRTDKA
jgi:hypothetical protein